MAGPCCPHLHFQRMHGLQLQLATSHFRRPCVYHCSTTPDFPRMSFLLQEHTLRTCHAGQAPLAKGMHRHLKVKCLCTQLAPFVASATNHRRLKPRVSHPLLFIRRWTHCCPATSLCQPLTSQFTATNSVCYVSFVYVRFCLACTQAASSQRHSSSAASQHLDTPWCCKA